MVYTETRGTFAMGKWNVGVNLLGMPTRARVLVVMGSRVLVDSRVKPSSAHSRPQTLLAGVPSRH